MDDLRWLDCYTLAVMEENACMGQAGNVCSLFIRGFTTTSPTVTSNETLDFKQTTRVHPSGNIWFHDIV